MALTDDFVPDEVMTDFCKFKEICAKKKLNKKATRWLNEWNSWDLACSPMDDNERQLIRYGHYLGWYSSQLLKHKDKPKKMPDNRSISQAVDDANQKMINSNGYGY